MKRLLLFAIISSITVFSLTGCAKDDQSTAEVISIEDIAEKIPEEKNTVEDNSEEEVKEETEEITITDVAEEEAKEDQETITADEISEDQALNAIQNYCYTLNPDLEGIVEAGEYPVYWEIESSDESQIVVLYRSYTGALVRYYIDRSTGDTHVTEFVPGITDEEEPTAESFNVKDYIK